MEKNISILNKNLYYVIFFFIFPHWNIHWNALKYTSNLDSFIKDIKILKLQFLFLIEIIYREKVIWSFLKILCFKFECIIKIYLTLVTVKRNGYKLIRLCSKSIEIPQRFGFISRDIRTKLETFAILWEKR